MLSRFRHFLARWQDWSVASVIGLLLVLIPESRNEENLSRP